MKKNILFLLLLNVSLGLNAQYWESIFPEENQTNFNPVFFDILGSTNDDCFYIVGSNFVCDTINYHGIIKWDGLNFSPISDSTNYLYTFNYGGINGDAMTLAQVDSDIYFGGRFLLAGHDTVNGIARWDGSEWHSLGGGLLHSNTTTGLVRTIEYIDGLVYIGGTFDSISGHNFICNSFVAWNGNDYIDIPPIPIQSSEMIISSIAKFQDEIFVAGNFGDFGSQYQEIAKWDGNAWTSVGGGIKGQASVISMKVYNNKLFVGGFFYKADGNAGDFIMSWDGEKWSEVGNGLLGINEYSNGTVNDLQVFNDCLWVGGYFNYAGGVYSNRIAKWNGESWCSLENSLENPVKAITVWKDSLYIISRLATYNHIQLLKWTGGNYTDSCSSPLGINQLVENSLDRSFIYPNPTNGIINFNIDDNEYGLLSIYSINGQLVYQQVSNLSQPLDLSFLRSGTYLIKYKDSKVVYHDIVFLATKT